MSSIDDRVVNMQFNNQQFQQGVAETNKSIADLKDNLKLDGATSGIDNVQKASDRFSLQGMENALSNISSHFSVFGAVGFTVISNLTTDALNAGKKMADALIGPLVDGGAKRALALQQAKFQFKGLGLDIQSTMNAALGAVKGTAFGLDDAATAAAQFGASGITAATGLEKDLRAVAGVAAQTGSAYGDIAPIFESIAGNGRVMGQDLLQLSSRGVNAAAVLAKSLGTTEANVRAMVTKGKISFKEFSDAMYQAFGANAANANQTYTGALANMHAALARIGADVASPYFLGMRDIFNALGPLFDTIHTAIAPFLADLGFFQTFSAAGLVKTINGVAEVIQKFIGGDIGQILHNIYTAVMAVGGAFKIAFKEVFPPLTLTQIIAIAGAIERFTASLIPTSKAANDLRRTFAGVFAIFDIVWQVVSAVATAIGHLIGVTAQGTGGFLAFTAKIGDWLVKVDLAIKNSGALVTFFHDLGDALAIPIRLMQTFFGILGDGMRDLSKANGEGFKAFLTDIGNRFKGLGELAQFFVDFWNGVVRVAKAVWSVVEPIFKGIGEVVKRAVDAVFDSLKGLKFDDALKAVNTGIFASFVLIVRGFFGNLGGVLRGNGLVFVSQFKTIMTSLNTNLKALEMNTNVKTLEAIAISIALLAASAVALSLVDSVKLATALGAIGALMAGLIGTFAVMKSINGDKGIVEILGIALAMGAISSAILVLSGAIAILGALPLGNLIQGVIAFAAVLGILVGALALLKNMGPGVLIAAGAIAILAPAMAVLAGAVAILGAIPYDNLVKGLKGFTIILGELVVALLILNKSGPGVLLAAVAMAAMAGSITLLVGAVALLGALKMDNLNQGLIGLGITLAIVVIALNAMEGSIAGAAAMVIASVAITILAAALKVFSTLTWDEIGRSMVALGGSLAILAVALTVMGDPLVLLGSAALLVAAVGLMALAPALVLLGTMSWDAIGRGLTVLAAGIVILAVGGLLLIPASVGFLLLGTAIFLLGTGVLEASIGIAALAAALVVLTGVGAGAISVFILGIEAFIKELPKLGAAAGSAIVNMAVVIGDNGPKLTDAFAKVLVAMLKAVDKVGTQIVKTATDLIVALVKALVVLIPLMATAGLQILVGVLNGIAKNIGQVVTAGTNIVVNFLNGIGNNVHRVTDAAADLVIKFVNALATTIRTHTKQMNDAGLNLAGAIVDGMTGGLASKVGDVWRAAQKLVAGIPSAIKSLLHINSPSKVTTELGEFTGDGVVEGLNNRTDNVHKAASNLGQAAVDGLRSSITGISEALQSNVDMTPTIRPVLDLSGVQEGAKQMSGMLGSPKLSASTSSDVATSVALQEQAKNAQMVLDKNAAPTDGNRLTFIQNNTSPAALSTVEIYRQTNNQLSTLKEALGVVNETRSP